MTLNLTIFCRLAGSPGETNERANVEQQIIKSDLKKISLNTFGAALTVATAASVSSFPSISFAKDKKVWQKVDLPIRETLFDISFDPAKPEHGWLVGVKGTFLETFDGGDSWSPRSFTNLDEEVNFNSISKKNSFNCY